MSGDKAHLFLDVYGADHQHIFHALARHRDEIDARLEGGVAWHQGEDQSWITLEREAVQPYLDRVMAALESPQEEEEAAE